MTTNNQTNFQNDSIQVNLKEEPGCKISLDVTVNPEATQASYHKAISSIRKEVSVPGFRKGKAPDAMILQNYEKHVEKEWKDILLNTTLDEAIKLTKVVPFNRNSVKAASIKSASQKEGSVLHFEYEAAPEIPSISPEKISLKAVPLKTVTQKDIDKTIEDLSYQSAEWNDVTDRPVQEDDFVVVDVDDIGEAAKNICTDSLFSVKKGKMGEWMRKLVIGMKPGESAEAMSEKEEHDEDCKACEDGTQHDHNPNFISTLCRITLHTIRHAKPHPLDDALAKKYGTNSIQELTDRVKTSLENRATEEQKDQSRYMMEAALLNQYPFEMPASLVQGEVKAVRKMIIDNLRAEGTSESEIQAKAKQIEMEAAQKYDRDFRLYFLTQKYAKEQNLIVGQDETMMEVMRQMWLKKMGQNTIDTSMDPKEMQLQIQLQLLAVKAIDQMIEKATILQK
ncbi:MAG TPA: trigger factor [Parachlamydiaceae bacterium]|nr:trigger factor [Parachlamydiaceae bacterium]